MLQKLDLPVVQTLNALIVAMLVQTAQLDILKSAIPLAV